MKIVESIEGSRKTAISYISKVESQEYILVELDKESW